MTKDIKNQDEVATVQEYVQVVHNIKLHIQRAQVKAVLTVNKELIMLYWNIGKIIAMQQEIHGWGSSFVENLAKDLQSSFPGMGGFSRSNVFKMKQFYLTYEKVSQAVRLLDDLAIFNIPWGQNIVLFTRLNDVNQMLWYAQSAIEYGWSRSILELQIDSQLFVRQGKAVNNFKDFLPSPDSDMAQQAFKDPYIFDFLMLAQAHKERDLEQGLMYNVEKLLLEMGDGFSLYGRQYHVRVGTRDYYIDLLFYHTKLQRYIVVELKARDLESYDAGQISFYITAIDEKLRGKNDNPTIGLILCKDKDHYTAEYALKSTKHPIGIASYKTELIKKLPKELQSSLPSIADIEAELEKVEKLNVATPVTKL